MAQVLVVDNDAEAEVGPLNHPLKGFCKVGVAANVFTCKEAMVGETQEAGVCEETELCKSAAF